MTNNLKSLESPAGICLNDFCYSDQETLSGIVSSQKPPTDENSDLLMLTSKYKVGCSVPNCDRVADFEVSFAGKKPEVISISFDPFKVCQKLIPSID